MAKKKHTRAQKTTAEKQKPENKKTQTLSVLRSKIKTKNNTKKIIDDHASDEEPQSPVLPLSSTELEGINARSSTDEDDDIVEKEVKKKNKGKIDKVKIKGSKKREIQEDDDEEPDEKSDAQLYKFPMNRISRIIKSDNSDLKISQEAVFLINKASERFLELFAKEAYANAFLEGKKNVGYNHLSSVVTKRRRFEFLSDFVPEKVTAEDALNQMAEGDK